MNKVFVTVAMAVLVFLIYAPSLRNQYVYDDILCIESNRELDRPISEWLFNRRYFLTTREFSYRPLVSLTHLMDRRYGPEFGHALNMILHFFVGWALFSLARRCVTDRAALLGTFLFLVHPAYSEVVYIITFREDLLCSLFLLLTLILGLEGGLYGCILTFTAALFSKESALLFPLFAALICRRPEFKSLRVTIPGLVLAAAIYAAIRFIFLKHYYLLIPGPHDWLPVESSVLTGFIRLLLYPEILSVDHSILARPGFWRAWPGLFAALALIYFAGRLFWKNSMGYVPLTWLILFIAPTLNILPLHNISAERYLYLPMILPFVGIGYWIDQWIGYPGNQGRRKWALIAVSLAIVILGIRTHVRGYDFKNNEILYKKEIQVNSMSRTMPWALGNLYFLQGKLDDSRKYLQKALSLDPNFYPAWVDMGRLEFESGNTEAAGLNFEKAAKIAPTDPMPLLMLAAYKMNMGDTAGAMPLYHQAIRLPPTPAVQNQAMIDILRSFRTVSAGMDP